MGACAADEQVDVVDHGRAAGDGDMFAFDVGTQRTVGVGRTFELEVEGADVDGIGDFEVARFAVKSASRVLRPSEKLPEM